MGEGEHLGALGEEAAEVDQVEPSLVGDRDPPQRRASAARELLPRHQVGVVLHLGDEDLVPLAELEPGGLGLSRNGVRERVGHEVERLGGVLGEHHLVGLTADEGGNPRTGPLVAVGGLLRELVRPTVNGRVGLLGVGPLGVEGLRDPVRRGTGVEVDQRLPVADGARQDREVRPDLRDVHQTAGALNRS